MLRSGADRRKCGEVGFVDMDYMLGRRFLAPR
jgi:hypothetical protein